MPTALSFRDSFYLCESFISINDQGFPRDYPELHRDLQYWLLFHQIDPHWVPLCSTIIRNTELCRVEYETIERVLEDNGNRPGELYFYTYWTYSQGEAPSLPFPGMPGDTKLYRRRHTI